MVADKQNPSSGRYQNIIEWSSTCTHPAPSARVNLYFRSFYVARTGAGQDDGGNRTCLNFGDPLSSLSAPADEGDVSIS